MWPDEVASYTGEFKEDKRDGYGEYVYNYGSRQFRGYWKKDKQHGIGFVTGDLDLNERKGLWDRGRLCKWLINRNGEEEVGDGLPEVNIEDSMITVMSTDRNDFEMSYSQASTPRKKSINIPGSDTNDRLSAMSGKYSAEDKHLS